MSDLAPHTGGVALDPEFHVRLVQTIERYNEMAATGVDSDFGRGSTAIERAWAPLGSSDPDHSAAPNPTMAPIDVSGSLHCVILGGGALDTKGGPVTDERGRMMDVDGEVILGLYGAGNCVASPAGQAYFGPGTTVGLALVFGYLAGAHAASRAS